MRKALYFLAILDDSDREWIIRNGKKMKIQAGTVLIDQGKPTEWLYFVMNGAFVVYSRNVPHIEKLKSGEVIGEISFVDSRPPTASVRAEVDSEVGAISRQALTHKLQGDISFAAHFYQSIAVFLADRLRTTVESLGGHKLQLAEEVEDVDEVAPQFMRDISMAGMHFAEMQRRRWGSPDVG